jgi:hypothetical protein
MSKDLTIKQKKFVKGYLEGRPITKAAVEAGYSPATAARGATELLSSPKVQATIKEAMDASGITREKLAATIAGALDAERPIVVAGEIRSWPDHNIRLKATELCLSLSGEDKPLEEHRETYEEMIFRIRRSQSST